VSAQRAWHRTARGGKGFPPYVTLQARSYRLNRAFVLGALLACAPAQAAHLPRAVSAALKEAGIPASSVGILAQRLESPRPTVAWQPDVAFNPASTLKLLTTFAALDMLGPAHRFQTEILASAPVRDGVLEGDLILRGGGDPKLTIERIWLLVRELRTLGLREIRGRLLFDPSLYDLPPQDGDFDATPWAAYNTPPAPLVANFNVVTLRLAPRADTLDLLPDAASLRMPTRSEVTLDDAPCDGWRERLVPVVTQAAPLSITVRGSYARACGEKRLALNLLPAHVHAGQLFGELWREAGGIWPGEVGTGGPGAAPADVHSLLTLPSPPLAELVRDVNKYSNNLMARMLYLALGLHAEGPPATLEKSSRAVHAWLDGKHLSLPSLTLDNGAGLSRNGRIDARDMARLLRAAHASPHAPEFLASLPLLGVDGTLSTRMKDGPLKGRARLKTGTLSDAKALAGYLTDRGGHVWVVVFLINHARAEHGTAAQDALLEWIDKQPSGTGSRQP
jgi:D-alanyl-D-alanine carboxypeptidase/D-alanyl-D-alanine-endopeptidase (penicillin-binding protein 4)